jgi:hypothetical protein
MTRFDGIRCEAKTFRAGAQAMVRQYRVHVMESKGMENEHEAECWGTTRTITTSNQVTWLLRANVTGICH